MQATLEEPKRAMRRRCLTTRQELAATTRTTRDIVARATRNDAILHEHHTQHTHEWDKICEYALRKAGATDWESLTPMQAVTIAAISYDKKDKFLHRPMPALHLSIDLGALALLPAKLREVERKLAESRAGVGKTLDATTVPVGGDVAKP